MAGAILVAVDPGLRGCGVAVFRETDLIWAGYAVGATDTNVRRADAWRAMVRGVQAALAGVGGLLDEQLRPQHLAIELPQVYRDSHQRGAKRGTDPNDLIELGAVVGGVEELLGCATTVYLPREWKGQAPKEIVHDRARARLSAAETAAVKLPRASLAHNVWDAVALGLRHLGRL